MKKKNVVMSALLAMAFTLTGAFSAQAVGADQETSSNVVMNQLVVTTDLPIARETVRQTFDAGEEINKLEPVIYTKGIRISDKSYNLYPEFENPDRAVNELWKCATKAIDYLQDNYDVSSLSRNNYKEYQAYISSSLGDEAVLADETLEKQLCLMENFLDIYENNDDNQEILEAVATVNGNFEGNTVQEVTQVVNELYLALPYNTGATEAIEEAAERVVADVVEEYALPDSQAAQTQAELLAYSGNSAFSVSKGITYAKKYAVNRNTAYTSFSGSDCTNFTSQIKRAGGVADHVEWSSGPNPYVKRDNSWYYTNANNYGTIWVNANKFAKFFGVKSTTKNFNTLSTKIKKGSFIGYDKTGDGGWDHMAFVTVKTESKKTTNGVTYYDFKVAQHSSNYHAYVSDEANGWEKLKKDNSKLVFCIVN